MEGGRVRTLRPIQLRSCSLFQVAGTSGLYSTDFVLATTARSISA